MNVMNVIDNMQPLVGPLQSVLDIMVLCGLSNTDAPNPNPTNNPTTAQRIATKVFIDGAIRQKDVECTAL